MMKIAGSILETIGKTPLVRINRMNPNPKVEIFAKLEKFNPGGSVKDRVALSMIERAENEGKLTTGKIVLEPTSGNTGIGLALVCAVKGYPLELVMPESMSMERRKTLAAYGAKVILSPASKGMDGAQEMAAKMLAENPGKYFMPNQFANEANWTAHYENTANEILEDTKARIDFFVAGMGTTGTLMGISRRFKQANQKIKIIGVEPYPNTKIQGLKNMDTQKNPAIYDRKLIDEKVNVKDDDAMETARQLALKEGIFCGISSGAAMFAAIEQAKKMKSGTIVVLLPDGGEKYLSTCLFDPEKCMECESWKQYKLK